MNKGDIDSIGVGDELTLNMKNTKGQAKLITVKVIELTAEPQRCSGCGCKFHDKSGKNKKDNGDVFCNDCNNRRN